MAKVPQAVLVADIGGTNARFALADSGAADLALRMGRTYRTEDFPHLHDALAAYIEETGLGKPPERAALAIASPVRGDHVMLTNRAWSFACSGLRDRFGFRRLLVINDFAAVAHALPFLKSGDLHRVGAPQAEEGMSGRILAVVGPGTGLGVAALVETECGRTVIDSEGGHASFAPADGLESELLRILRAKFGHVSFERLLSGAGMVNIYRTLAEIEGAGTDVGDPAELVRRAMSGQDRLCVVALERYCAILGGFTGDTALTFGAGRIFIAGGIVPRFADFLARSAFRSRFEAKGRFGALLRSVPSDVILHPQLGLLGAARALDAEHKGEM